MLLSLCSPCLPGAVNLGLFFKSIEKRIPITLIKGEYLVKNTTDIRIDVIFYD